MGTDVDFAEYVREQARGAGEVALKKMFGEYAVYVDGLVVALACDNQLFLKPTPATAARLATATMAPPYPGAKPHALIDEWLDDPEALAALLRDTAKALPPPKPKAAKKAAAKPAAPKQPKR
ncbi:TfoX/Sxy family protein [Silanimonas sp.]|jgi:TfoX/Sxy family transcriptional regulator of competence genes|uniref:TfoX/Sxy family protein n=1 Tax=Silanimonas sp. TaxID=1929290 RepID=UPI0037C7C197